MWCSWILNFKQSGSNYLLHIEKPVNTNKHIIHKKVTKRSNQSTVYTFISTWCDISDCLEANGCLLMGVGPKLLKPGLRNSPPNSLLSVGRKVGVAICGSLFTLPRAFLTGVRKSFLPLLAPNILATAHKAEVIFTYLDMYFILIMKFSAQSESTNRWTCSRIYFHV